MGNSPSSSSSRNNSSDCGVGGNHDHSFNYFKCDHMSPKGTPIPGCGVAFGDATCSDSYSGRGCLDFYRGRVQEVKTLVVTLVELILPDQQLCVNFQQVRIRSYLVYKYYI
jgi:hypothetical protein